MQDANHPPQSSSPTSTHASPPSSPATSPVRRRLRPFLTPGFALWPGQPGQADPQVYIGSGRYPPRDPRDYAEVVYEFRLLGIGGPDGQRTDSTLIFPDSPEMVFWGRLRWEGWVQAFQTGDESLLPALLPEQRHALLVIARFLRALCRRGADSIDIGEWPEFWDVLMDGYPPCQRLTRGEAHLTGVANWLLNRYPDILGHK